MNDEPYSDQKIVESWAANANRWTIAVREGHIESRRQVTDHAIVDAVLSRTPGTVLDIGCGEGWLVRALAAKKIEAAGVDVVPQLIEFARRSGGGDFYTLSYQEIASGQLQVAADVVVCNFALLGKESVEELFMAVPSLLHPQGAFIVQTLHPLVACGDLPYRDGWRESLWAGFSSDFTDPAPWYFRTLENWVALFDKSGFQLHEVREPLYPKTRKPASIIFVGTMQDAAQ